MAKAIVEREREREGEGRERLSPGNNKAIACQQKLTLNGNKNILKEVNIRIIGHNAYGATTSFLLNQICYSNRKFV